MVYSAPTWVRRACGGVRLKPIEVQTKPDSMIVDDFPMTITGKVRKVEMREQSTRALGLSEQKP
jgi:hypothetical protein